MRNRERTDTDERHRAAHVACERLHQVENAFQQNAERTLAMEQPVFVQQVVQRFFDEQQHQRRDDQKTKIMASGPVPSWQIDGETAETVADFIFGGSKTAADGDCSFEIKRRLLLGRKVI